MKWTTLSREQLAEEKQASVQRQQNRLRLASLAKGNPQFAGLHMAMPRYSLGSGSFIVSVKKGKAWL